MALMWRLKATILFTNNDKEHAYDGEGVAQEEGDVCSECPYDVLGQ